MVIILACSCGKHLQIGEDRAGERGLCPVCGSYLSIPKAADSPSCPTLAPDEIPLPLLLALREEPAPLPESSPAVPAAPEPREPELAATTPAEPTSAVPVPVAVDLAESGPADALDPVPVMLEPSRAESPSPRAGTPSAAETVVVAPIPLSALLTVEEPLDFVDREEATRPRYGVFPPVAVFLAALLGGVLGAAFVLAYNYQSLRRPWAMRLTGALGVAAFLAFLVLISVWPPIHQMPWLRLALFATMAPLWVAVWSFPLAEKSAILLPALVLYGVAWALRRDLYYDHLRRGGKPASIWNAVAMSLFCAVFEVTGIGLHHALFPDQRGIPARKLVVGPSPRLAMAPENCGPTPNSSFPERSDML